MSTALSPESGVSVVAFQFTMMNTSTFKEVFAASIEVQ